MKPRVMMVIYNFRPGPAGGTELQAEQLAIRLHGLGYPMQVLTSHTVPDSPKEEDLQGVQIHRAIDRLPHYDMNGGNDMFHYLVQQRKTYDILHVHMAFCHAVIAVRVAHFFRKKCIIKIACAGEYGDLFALSKFGDLPVALKALRQADAMVAISAEVEQELLHYNFLNNKIVYIPNGVDTTYFHRTQPFPPRSKTLFILIGRRHPQKGIDTTLHAARLLQERGLGEHFEIRLYGLDYPEYNYPQMAQELGVTGVVKFFPFVRDILSVYHAAHCFLLPSRGEGLSNSLLEALAMELPVIVTPVSGMRDVVDDGKEGFIIPTDSSVALATAMVQVITQPELVKQLGQNGRRKVERLFSFDKIAQQYSELYERLCYPGS